ncbi:MAG: hypothetical protein K2P12_04050 [Clostridia bacterium]|nr:hypothetical protein [Clostridia bacterium]
MKGILIFLVVVSLLFFITKLVLTIVSRLKKDNYYSDKWLKLINDYGLIAYIVLLYALSISLYLANDYSMAEVNFTLIVLAIATVLLVGEKIYQSLKIKNNNFIQSNIYDLNELVKNEEFKGVITKNGNDFTLEDKEKFENLISDMPVADSKKLLKKRMLNTGVINGLSIILSITILVVGLVRGA